MNIPTGWELVLVLLVIVLVFGSKRLPDSARALGRSMRILKAETKGLHDDDAPTGTQASSTTTRVVAPASPPPSAPYPPANTAPAVPHAPSGSGPHAAESAPYVPPYVPPGVPTQPPVAPEQAPHRPA